jgi:peptide deformylase
VAEKLPIVKEPHKVLRNEAKEIPLREITGKKIQKLISDMKATLAATPDGVGLAAPQIGRSLSLFIISDEANFIGGKGGKKESLPPLAAHGGGGEKKAGSEKKEAPKWHYYVFVNPVVKNCSRKKIDGAEGCLSVPETFGVIKRHEKMTVEAYDENGKKFTRGASKFFARVIQHELDHLEGILFIDKAEKLIAKKSRQKHD